MLSGLVYRRVQQEHAHICTHLLVARLLPSTIASGLLGNLLPPPREASPDLRPEGIYEPEWLYDGTTVKVRWLANLPHR